ncbi:hypothetical protein [Cytophaga hutchinsonii]|uniref:Uncharacterized protein n=1 Tax=Cytophaga hutchinsonii (strain ATCC 33406 / DSM 1761 / CIP 103989 / NBRC 15051 / NCIMB 9469 / D465) TaxID=269798 RepID=A0A6N4SVW3_CYTH3|nr:hypothetical protein [Cytophaga hutchinsonii]ABG60712.1 conserved hypothetical protein [Cytophaga hutchinsonii ATCC 33406]SFX70204.1 hypothetical protein SAMN04487930_10837 [Cytophaga hutchinsonii ATCC 33406]
MGKYLDKCFDIIFIAFPTDWINHPTFNSSNPEYLLNLLSLVNNTHNDLIYNLHLSVISGEYIEDLKFEERLEEFKFLIEGIPSIPDSQIPFAEIESLSNILIKEFYLPYKIAINYYKGLISFYNRIVDGNSKGIIMDVFTLDSEEFKIDNPESELLKEISNFINYTLKLARIDHAIITSEQSLRDLLLIHDELEKLKSSEIYNLLYFKCSFLIKKILLRYKKSNLSYKINFKSGKLKPDNFDPGPFSYFDNWITAHDNNNPEIESSYNSDHHKEYIETAKGKFLKKEVLSYEDYHTLVRYYKDINQNELKIKELIKSFEQIDISAVNKFDKRAYNISLSYLHNNYFSYLLRDCEDNLEDIDSYFKIIISIQKDTHVFNYFPYERLAKCLVKQLNSIYEKNSSDSEIEIANKLLDKLEKIITELEINYAWCEENKFLIYQHPFKECTFPFSINGESVNVFLQSSFVLPTNYAEDRNEIKSINEDLILLKTIHKLHISISKEKKEIKETKDEVKETKNKLDQSDKRNIEILSIFSAIVVFATATTQLFPFIKSTSGALQFMLVFSFSLCSFVLVIWLITRESEIRKLDFPILHKSFLAAFILITIILGLESYYFKEPNLMKEIESNKIDSINIVNLKRAHTSDSLRIQLLNNRIDSLSKIIVKPSPGLDSSSVNSNNH